jgi:hypothetical protein
MFWFFSFFAHFLLIQIISVYYTLLLDHLTFVFSVNLPLRKILRVLKLHIPGLSE